MPLIAANDLITIGNFGKPGENFGLEKNVVHFWGNCIDAGLEIVFRKNHHKLALFSLEIKGEIHFNTQWGRVRVEYYDDLSADAPIFADEKTFENFQIDPEIFRTAIFKLGKKVPPLRKVQLVFIGPAMIDIFFRDIIVK